MKSARQMLEVAAVMRSPLWKESYAGGALRAFRVLNPCFPGQRTRDFSPVGQLETLFGKEQPVILQLIEVPVEKAMLETSSMKCSAKGSS